LASHLPTIWPAFFALLCPARIIATAGISGAAFFRWHVAILFHDEYAAYAASYVFLLLLATYDLWSTHKINRATIWGSAFLVFMEQDLL
jgi:hypothetical protein